MTQEIFLQCWATVATVCAVYFGYRCWWQGEAVTILLRHLKNDLKYSNEQIQMVIKRE